MDNMLKINVNGHVLIKDSATKEVLVDVTNAVHSENMSRLLARALAREEEGYIYEMALGNGGTFLNSSDQIVYRTPNVLGAVSLYNETYSEIVEEGSIGFGPGNSVTSASSPPPAVTSLVICTVELDPTEPPLQSSSDDVPLNAAFVFDELGLKSKDGLLLTHVVFAPVAKTANRGFTITYTLTISCN